MDYRNEPLRRYFDDAAAARPTPGGGSVAAVAAALASTMASMAAGSILFLAKIVSHRRPTWHALGFPRPRRTPGRATGRLSLRQLRALAHGNAVGHAVDIEQVDRMVAQPNAGQLHFPGFRAKRQKHQQCEPQRQAARPETHGHAPLSGPATQRRRRSSQWFDLCCLIPGRKASGPTSWRQYSTAAAPVQAAPHRASI